MMKIIDLATHPEQHVTVAELARYSRLSPAKIRDMVHAGELSRLRIPAAPKKIVITTASARKQFRNG